MIYFLDMCFFAIIVFASSMAVVLRSIDHKDIPIMYVPDGDIVVNTNKGFVLERVGTYFRKFEQEIIHTFVPLRDACAVAPTSEVCLRVPHNNNNNRNSIELGIILSSKGKDHAIVPLKKRDISTLIN